MLSSPSHPLHLVLGLIIWALWFVAMYGALSVVCNVAPPTPSLGALTWINGKLLLLTVLVTLWLLIYGYRCWRASTPGGNENTDQRFISQVAAGAYLLAAAATLMIGLPVLVLPPCL